MTGRAGAAAPLLLLLAAMSSRAAEPQVATGPTTALSLADAVDLALRRDESVEVRAARVQAADAARVEALTGLFPTASLSAGYTHRPYATLREIDGNTLVLQAQDGVNATLDLTADVLDATAIGNARATALSASAAAYDLAEARRALALQVADAFLTAIATERVRAAASRRVELGVAAKAASALRVEAGLAPSTERSRAELEAAAAALGETRAEGAVAKARAALELLIGEDLAGRSLLPPPVAEPGATPSSRPDVEAAKQRALAAEALAIVPGLGFVPNLAVRGAVRATNEAGFSGRNLDGSVGATLTWAFWDGGARLAKAAQRRAELREALAVESATQRRARLAVDQARTDWEIAVAARAQAGVRAGIAEQHGRDVAARFQEGLVGALEAAEAAVEAFEAEADLARAELDVALSVLRLAYASGAELDFREGP